MHTKTVATLPCRQSGKRAPQPTVCLGSGKVESATIKIFLLFIGGFEISDVGIVQHTALQSCSFWDMYLQNTPRFYPLP